jgi:hypothetical protein
VEVVINATQTPARIVSWNDIGPLQGKFPMEPTVQGSDQASDRPQ